jgi:hypothetical protein
MPASEGSEHLQQRDVTEYLRYMLNAFDSRDLTEVGYYRVNQNASTRVKTLHREPSNLLALELVGSSVPEILRQVQQVETADGEDGQPTHYFWSGFSSLPPILMISLNRFSFGEAGEKRKDSVRIPPEIEVAGRNLNVVNEEGVSFTKKYVLAGIYLHHEGEGINSGHYTFVTPGEKGIFSEHNDTIVTQYTAKEPQAKFKSFLEENAYVVMYREVKE